MGARPLRRAADWPLACAAPKREVTLRGEEIGRRVMLDRRKVSAGLLGLSAAPKLARAARGQGVIEAEPTWSESAMVLYFDP